MLLARCHTAAGEFEEAEPLWLSAQATAERTYPPGHPQRAVMLRYLAQFYDLWGQPEEADRQRGRAADEPVESSGR